MGLLPQEIAQPLRQAGRQGLLSGACSCLGVGAGRAETWQRFPHLLQRQAGPPPLSGRSTGGRLIYCSVWRASSCFLETMSGGSSNPVPMATVLKSSKVKMMTEAAREKKFWCEDKSHISDHMTQSASSGCPSSPWPPFVRRPPQTGLHCSPRWCLWGPSQSLTISLNACPESTPSYFCFWVTEITSAQPPEADCSVGWHILAALEPWAGAAHSCEAQATSAPPASRASARQSPPPRCPQGSHFIESHRVGA